ncbi:MAG: nucleotidyltransferase family protein [Gemmatimonadaceae bacterium]
MIVGLVLAAGRSTRFGAPKVLARVRGIELVRHVVDRVAAAGIDRIVVTAGEEVADIREALSGTPAEVVLVPLAGQGLSASLRAGIDALPDECTGFVVALGDQPFIDPELIRRLRDTWETSNAAAVVPVYRNDERGNPVFFDATMRRRLRELTGDAGARDLLISMGERVVHVPVQADAPRDVDTPSDLEQLGA